MKISIGSSSEAQDKGTLEEIALWIEEKGHEPSPSVFQAHSIPVLLEDAGKGYCHALIPETPPAAFPALWNSFG